MIRTNLSTRPFYNERVVSFWLLLFLVIVVAATIFNTDARAALFAQRHGAGTSGLARRGARRRAAEATAAKLRDSRGRQADRAASSEARQANDLIDRRTFSWTELFNASRQRCPTMCASRPCGRTSIEGKFRLKITVVARSVEDINEFMNNLADDRRVPRGRLLDLGTLHGRRRGVGRGGTRATTRLPVMPPAAKCADEGTAMTLLRRIVSEKRGALVPLALALLVEHRRLRAGRASARVKSATAADRAAAAAAVAQAAERDVASAEALVAGKDNGRPGAEDLLPESAAGESGPGAPHDVRAPSGAGEKSRTCA